MAQASSVLEMIQTAIKVNEADEERALTSQAQAVITQTELQNILDAKFMSGKDRPSLTDLIDGILNQNYVLTESARQLASQQIMTRKKQVKDEGVDTTEKVFAGCWTHLGSDLNFVVMMDQGKGWHLPGGTAKEGEGRPATAARESLEETGFVWRLDNTTPLREFGAFHLYSCHLEDPLAALLIVSAQEYAHQDADPTQPHTTIAVKDLRTLTGEVMRFKQERLDALRELARQQGRGP